MLHKLRAGLLPQAWGGLAFISRWDSGSYGKARAESRWPVPSAPGLRRTRPGSFDSGSSPYQRGHIKGVRVIDIDTMLGAAQARGHMGNIAVGNVTVRYWRDDWPRPAPPRRRGRTCATRYPPAPEWPAAGHVPGGCSPWRAPTAAGSRVKNAACTGLLRSYTSTCQVTVNSWSWPDVLTVPIKTFLFWGAFSPWWIIHQSLPGYWRQICRGRSPGVRMPWLAGGWAGRSWGRRPLGCRAGSLR